jgi:hypothetical protein
VATIAATTLTAWHSTALLVRSSGNDGPSRNSPAEFHQWLFQNWVNC